MSITLERDNEGFLLQPEQWSIELAEVIARELGQCLEEHHWEIISFIRNYYHDMSVVPEARRVLKFMKNTWGEEYATRHYLYHLFPTGYGQSACKIAGMRKPLKLMLDV